MSEKKIVIKLNYGTPKPKQQRSTAPLEYEWNYKRIVIALVIGIISCATLGYWLSTPTPMSEVTKQGTGIDSETVSTEKQASLIDSRNVDNERSLQNSDSDPSHNSTGSELTRGELVETAQVQPRTDNKEFSKQDSLELDVADTAAFQQSTNIVASASVAHKNVSRAQFSWGIKDQEPTSEIISPAILRPGDSVVLYFFSEFNDMTGQSLSHEWSHNGKVHSTKKFQIGKNRWRVFSSKQLTSDLLGEWKVSIKDSSGKELGQYELNVLEPKT